MCFRPPEATIAPPKKCPACGQRNPGKNKVCRKCGADLPETMIPCPHCGQEQAEGTKLCANCGFNGKLGSGDPAKSKPSE